MIHYTVQPMAPESTLAYGTHPVQAALTHKPECVVRVFLEEGHPRLRALAREKSIPVSALTEREMGRHLEDAVHQGAAALVTNDRLYTPLPRVLESIDIETNPALVMLGEVQDPQNVGAIIRSAAALGISAVLIPKDRQAQITGAAIKASAGAAFSVPLVPIGNVNQTVGDLKERGFWIYGLSGAGEKPLSAEVFDAPTVFIVGNEARGIREKTLEHCDVVLTIPIRGVESLNASVAAAIAFYEWGRSPRGTAAF